MRTNDSFLNMLEVVDKPFYFGCGGLGDFLLLMSTFYDKIKKDEVDVLFVANSLRSIKEISKQFSKIKRWWFFPRGNFSYIPSTWDNIYGNPLCKGTGITPKDFKFIEDWQACGKSTVFNYYDVNRSMEFTKCYNDECEPPLRPILTLHPYGGSEDPTNIRRLSNTLIRELVNETYKDWGIYIIGSPQDLKQLKKILKRSDQDRLEFISDFEQCMSAVTNSKKHICVNTWTKTWAALSRHKDITIYRSKYVNASKIQMFGEDKNPSDFCFIDGWGFKRADDPYND